MTTQNTAPFVTSTTFVDLLRARALHQPDHLAYTFLLDGEVATASLTYAALDRQVRAIAALLQSSAAAGDRVLLLYPPGLDYIAAFFGCLYASVVAVPAYLPDPAHLQRTLPRLLAIVGDAQPEVVLTSTPIYSLAQSLISQDPAFQAPRWLTTDHLATDLPETWCLPSLHPSTLALLQYTSGSTAAPKGVMLTHANLLHNSALIQTGFAHTAASCGVIWLPPYHDMGLIGGILQPLYAGFPVTLLSPIDFLRRPVRWLQAISRYGATTSGGPNFAYDLCVRKIPAEQRATLDLSSWRVAFNGAEPIRAETLERFAEAFASCGFRKEAFYPCYGLAEATLLVSGGRAFESPIVRPFQTSELARNRAVVATDAPGDDVRALVGCGQCLSDQRLWIVDPLSRTRCADDRMGEIWLSGPSVAQGYWNRSEETAQTFNLAPPDSAEAFLRTGDLGFLHDGELFVTGRLKELMIIRGRNHHPQDIELTVERSHPAFRPGCGAAFSVVVEGEERLVIVQELDRQSRKPDVKVLAAIIRQAVAEQHEVHVHAVVLIKHGTIPKTSSGKIQRHAAREAFEQGSLEAIESHTLDIQATEEQAYRSETRWITGALAALDDSTARQILLTSYLQEQAAGILRLPPTRLDPQQPLDTLGIDSLMAVELAYALETELGVILPVQAFFQGLSLSQLTAQILANGLETAPATSLNTLVPAPQRSSEAPLSHGQRAIWFLHQLAPTSAAYNIGSAVRIHAELNIAALQRALQALIDRHPSLRTTFSAQGDEPVQHVLDRLELPFQIEDVSDWSERKLNEFLAGEVQHPFDLAHGPLLRMVLLSRSIHDHILLLVVHHIVADFWSLAVLAEEFGKCYAAERAGLRFAPEPQPVRYVDYVRWQANTLASAEATRLWSYWRQRLAGDLPVLDLPTDRPRPSVQTYHGAAQTLLLNDAFIHKVNAFSRDHGVTLYITLLAAFQVLLHRYTGQDDILVGSPTAGRSRADLARLIGYFINPVVLRADLSRDPSFISFLEQVRQTALEAFAHQDYPFSLLVERLQPDRDPSRSPIFQVMFVFQKAPPLAAPELAAFAIGLAGTRIDLDGLPLESVALDQRSAQFDLTLAAAEAADGLVLSLQYNCDLFHAATIQRMLGHLRVLLKSIFARPEQRISSLPLLPLAEQEELLLEWNDTTPGVRGRASGVRRRHTDSDLLTSDSWLLTSAFEAQAAHSPEAIALIAGFAYLSYAELNCRANQLAHHLRRHNVGPDVPVALCLERSPELVIGLLGILKADGAYIPLDPAYPAGRLAFMLGDSGAKVLLTQTAFDDRRWTMDDGLHSDTDIVYRLSSIVYLDADWASIATQPTHNPKSGASPNNLAYIMYTSGSTGTPKGVAITHQNVVAFLTWASLMFPSAQLRGVLAATSVCFDLSIFELFVPLSCGGTVILVDDVLQLPQLPAAAEVTLVNSVPSAVAALLRLEPLPAGVQAVNLAGEPLPGRLVEQLYQQPHIQQVNNLYGPSETTIYSTVAWRLRDIGSQPPIGRPIANTEVYLLDAHLQPVPIGVVGELYIGGAGMARGYHGRPDLTAERFVPNPFLKDEGGRMKDESARFILPPSSFRLYRTGDLARYLTDGAIEFLGRRDLQVKIRGFRVELGEVEAVLREHAAVRECAVLAREQRLVAYVVATADDRPQTIDDGRYSEPSSIVHRPSSRADELRSFLAARLPAYMLPSSFVVLDALPLTPNGKLDRRALPTPGGAGFDQGETFVPPRTPGEELLAQIFAALLGISQVGIHDNFFVLGGHSLLATQLVSRIREAFQAELSMWTIFETPTVASLNEQIERVRRAGQGPQMPPLEPISRDGDLPLSFAQQRLWFLDQLEPHSPAYNIPAAIGMSGSLDVAALHQSLRALVARHEALRTTFVLVGEHAAQAIAPAYAVPLPLLDLGPIPADARRIEIQRLTQAEVEHPFDLARGPLLRVTLLRLTREDHVLLLTMHHIISDAWSIGILVREMAVFYVAYSQGQPSALPGISIQYADYAVWQREYLQGQVLMAQLTYWREHLADLPILQLPTDHPRPPIQSFRGATHMFMLPRALNERLTVLSRQEGVTLFMALLAVFQILLARYSGQHDISVGTPVANRTHAATENLIGFFVNILVLRADLGGNPPFREALRRLREVSLGAYAHQEVPFEQVVEALQPVRDLSRNPLFQVMFALQNTPAVPLELPGLILSQLPTATTTTKFDLALSLTEGVDGLTGAFEYRTDLFEASTIVRMVGHFQTLLESIAANPTRRIATLPLLTTAEQQLLADWNATGTAYPHDQCVHQLFEAQALRTPDATGVVFETEHISYSELDRRAGQLARFLNSLGVGPEVRVALCLARSIELLVGLLGILKAGGAYVPLDSAYPPERLAFMLADADVRVLITRFTRSDDRRPTTDRIRDQESGVRGQDDAVLRPDPWPLTPDPWNVVDLHRDWPLIARFSPTQLSSYTMPANLAYIIYTSGSTGRPKGVQVEHHSLANTLCPGQQQCGFGPHDRMLSLASVAFDIALFELLTPLLSGGTVLLVSQEHVLALPHLLDMLRHVTVFHAVPSLMREIAEMLRAPDQNLSAYDHIRLVLVGGDVVPPALLAELQDAFRRAQISVLYGPTEATIICTRYVLSEEQGNLRQFIGTPLKNMQVHLCDKHGQLVSIGVVGELYISGDGVTRGYLNRPDLTAERFVPNPFLKDEGGRMKDESARFILPPSSFRLYRTGDLARYLPNGTLEFLGRLDDQVKVRGYRIELGEIETVLTEHDAVRECVVVACEDRPGDKRLVAYVVPTTPVGAVREPPAQVIRAVHEPPLRSSLVTDLRAFLKQKLPDYMLPAAFVMLEALPLTPTGKIDRNALPSPDGSRPLLDDALVAPRTKVEKLLAQIWTNVLRLEQVGVHDRFFALGGDSILGIQVIARAKQAGLLLTPRQLFQYQTIAELAAVAGTASTPASEQGLVTGALPLTPMQHWFFEQNLPDPHHFNQTLLFEVHQPLDVALLEQTLHYLLVQHDALRLRFKRTETGWQQRMVETALQPTVVRVDLGMLPPIERESAIAMAAAGLQASLDLADGPLLRSGLFDLGPDHPSRLLIIIHHLVVDRVSWRILLEDLQTAYSQLCRGEAVVMPRKTTSFKQWAERLCSYAQSDVLRAEQSYWLAKRERYSPRLPVDYPLGANLIESARTLRVALNVEETDALLHTVPPVYQTQINDVLLTALVQAYAEWTGKQILRIDLEGHGREDLFDDLDLSRTVGWFTTRFPVLLDLRQADGPGEALKAVKEQLRAIPRHGIGYGVLRYLSAAEDLVAALRALPLAEISFNYLGQLDQAAPAPELFALAHESSGPAQSPRGAWSHLLEINGGIARGQLYLDWTYSDQLHRHATIERLAQGYLETLRTLIAHCQSPTAGGYTPSDFPEANLSQKGLDTFLTRVNRAGRR